MLINLHCTRVLLNSWLQDVPKIQDNGEAIQGCNQVLQKIARVLGMNIAEVMEDLT
jgi:hypothetical protein